MTGQLVCPECYGQKKELHVVSPWYSGESSDNSAGKHQVPLAIFLPFSLPARIAFSIVRLTFDFRIGLGPVGRYFSMYNTTLGKICTKLGGSELWAIVGNNFMGHSMVHNAIHMHFMIAADMVLLITCTSGHQKQVSTMIKRLLHWGTVRTGRRAGSAMADLAEASCEWAVVWILDLGLDMQCMYELGVLWRG